VEYTYEKISENSDIINHHFDNGVPWVESLTGADYPENIMNDWSFRKSMTPRDDIVYVSVAALRSARDGLALYRGSADDMPLPEPWDSYPFNHENVKTAYLAYCKRTIDYFEPDYFNMNIEANLLHFLNPALWSDFIELHRYVYQELKTAYPALVIFASVTGAHLLDGYFEGNDHVAQRDAANEIIEYSDLYALSFYPHLSGFLGNPYPTISFDELLSISNKPFAIAETGYPAQSFNIDADGTMVTVQSDPIKQDAYLRDVLRACEKGKALFLIQFVIRDYDQLWEDLGSREDLTIAWRDTGLLDEEGQKRMSYNTWRTYFQRRIGDH
jgi:hypothetical protein